MNVTNYSVSELDQLQALAERYARYSRSAGGLSSVLGGSLCLLMFLLALWLPLSLSLRVLLSSFPLLWLAAKELLRRRYYQRDGAVEERLSIAQQRMHLGMTAFVALVSTLIVGFGVAKFGLGGLLALPWPMFGYFGFVAVMPWVVWRWLWSPSDFIVGVSLLCQAAVIVAGSHYRLDWVGAYMPFAAVVGIVLGYREHRDYLQLRRDLARFAGRAGA